MEGWRVPVGLEEKQQEKCNRQTPSQDWKSWPPSAGPEVSGLSHSSDPQGRTAARHPTGASPSPATEFNVQCWASLTQTHCLLILRCGLGGDLRGCFV